MNPGLKNLTIFLLSMLVVCAFVFDIYMVLGGKIDTSDPNKLILIGGAISKIEAMALMVLGYYFGSTKSSEEKNSTIASIIADKVPSIPSTQTTTSTTTIKSTPTEGTTP